MTWSDGKKSGADNCMRLAIDFKGANDQHINILQLTISICGVYEGMKLIQYNIKSFKH